MQTTICPSVTLMSDSGSYTVSQNASQVGDVAGNLRGAGTIGTVNVVVVADMRGQIDLTVLERSFNEIVRRHEVLRTTFTLAGQEPGQVGEFLQDLPVEGVACVLPLTQLGERRGLQVAEDGHRDGARDRGRGHHQHVRR